MPSILTALMAPPASKMKDPKAKRAKTGEKPKAMTGQQHGELPSFKEPTPAQRMKQVARDEKVHATRRWIAGELDNKKHAGIHERANRVLTGKVPAIKGLGKSKGNP